MVVTFILVVPALTPVTLPDELTVAILLLSELHEKDVEAPDGVTVGVKVLDSPIMRLMDAGNDTLFGTASVTVTVQYGAFAALEILEYTFMYVVPGLTPVTNPDADTVAMLLLLLLKYAFAADV